LGERLPAAVVVVGVGVVPNDMLAVAAGFAAAGLDAARDMAAAKKLLERRILISAVRLPDPAADLRALARS
jgi:Reductase C-terminal